jgi:hypothetical protein
MKRAREAERLAASSEPVPPVKENKAEAQAPSEAQQKTESSN